MRMGKLCTTTLCMAGREKHDVGDHVAELTQIACSSSPPHICPLSTLRCSSS